MHVLVTLEVRDSKGYVVQSSLMFVNILVHAFMYFGTTVSYVMFLFLFGDCISVNLT